MTGKREGFFADHLDPGSIFSEVLFGLIMVLTFTLGVGISITEEEGAARALLIAALGCNLAWGIIDGAMHVMGNLLDRGRKSRLIRQLKGLDDPAALAAIAREMDPPLRSVTDEAERARFYRGVLAVVRRSAPEPTRIRGEDWMGALAASLLVFLSALPAAVPFLFLDDHYLALRLSNGLLLALLFVTGFYWAGHAGVRRWSGGLSMLLIGVLLVVVAMALGG